MPAAHTNRRPDALDWANSNGWSHESVTYDDGQIIRDMFTRDGLTLRAVWLSTPFSDAMWARGLLSLPGRAVTVPRVSGGTRRPTLETVLNLTHPLTQ
jgi:hypothetical protein